MTIPIINGVLTVEAIMYVLSNVDVSKLSVAYKVLLATGVPLYRRVAGTFTMGVRSYLLLSVSSAVLIEAFPVLSRASKRCSCPC